MKLTLMRNELGKSAYEEHFNLDDINEIFSLVRDYAEKYDCKEVLFELSGEAKIKVRKTVEGIGKEEVIPALFG